MYRITLLLTLVLLIPDVYIYIVHIVRKTKNTWLRLSYWMPSIIILAAYIYFMYLAGDNPMANHTQAIGSSRTVQHYRRNFRTYRVRQHALRLRVGHHTV